MGQVTTGSTTVSILPGALGFRPEFYGKCQDYHMCCKAGHAECTSSSAINNHFGSTLCHLVARCRELGWKNRPEVLRVLVGAGCDLNIKNRAGRTAQDIDPVLFAEAGV
jgi:hypothetical protein